MSFEDFSYLQLWWPFVRWSGTICVILVEGIMGNISYEIILNLDQWLRYLIYRILFLAMAAILFGGLEPFVQFWQKAI